MGSVPRKELSLFDSTCLIVGIIIGAGIYETAPTVASSVTHWWGILALWVVGGLLSLAGALCYAELASAYPREGGDYVYLSRAYGPWAGFMFGWIQLVIVRPGDIALMAFVFARYAQRLFGSPLETANLDSPYAMLVYAGAAVAVLTAINVLGVREGKWTQNLLTVVKALGLLAILVAAIVAPPDAPRVRDTEVLGSAPLSLALILVLFTFGGWNEMAYVAAEVKNPRRNILRALVLGTVAVTMLYLLANAAFLYALGHTGMATSEAIAADTIRAAFPRYGGRMISALICISALGAINGLIFTGARISYAVGAEHKPFRLLGRWDDRTGTPIRALVVQAVIALVLIGGLGSFQRTILYTAAAVYSFYFATSLSVIVLRRKEPHIDRPYKLTGYPFTVIIFCASCAFLIYSALIYKPKEAAISCGIVLVGLVIYLVSRRRISNSVSA